MRKSLFRYTALLAIAGACLLPACKKAAKTDFSYTDAILCDAFGDVDAVANYRYIINQGEVDEFEGLERFAYKKGTVDADDHYSFFSEPDEGLQEMLGDIILPFVERDSAGRIRRIYTIEEDTLAHTYTYTPEGLLASHSFCNSDGYSERDTYTYDDKGWTATRVSVSSAPMNESRDSVIYTVTRYDDRGNWLTRDADHHCSETTWTDDRTRSTTETHIYTGREFRFIAYTGDSVRYSAFPDYSEENAPLTDSLRGAFCNGKVHTACDIRVSLCREAYGISPEEVNGILRAEAISGKGVKGSTLHDRAVSAWGKEEQQVPAIDDGRWIADPDYISIRCLKREVSAFSPNNRLITVSIAHYGSYSPTGDEVKDEVEYANYDIRTGKCISLRDLFRADRADALMEKIHGWDDTPITWEELCNAPFTVTWPIVSVSGPFIDLYIPDFAGYLTDYGQEVLWEPSATEVPFYD